MKYNNNNNNLATMYEYETLSSYTTGYYEIEKLTEECCLFV